MQPPLTRGASTTWIGRTLRDQGMPADEIRAVLLASDPELVRRYLELHRERLEERLAAHVKMLLRIERRLDRAASA